MESRPLLILVPLQHEADALIRALNLKYEGSKKTALGSFCTFASVRLQVIGPGAQVLPAIEDDGCVLVLAGLAGALDPSLQIGNVIIDSDPRIPGDHPIFASARAARLVSQTRIISTPVEKAELFRASGGAAAVDMESDAIRSLAMERGMPLIIVRAISDRADEVLHPAVASFVNAEGRTRPGAILRALLRRPWLIFQFLRLQRNSKIALANLGKALRDLLQFGTPSMLQPVRK